ncbi:integrase core domain-containing protein, partial [Shimia aestuarii]|uniref:integrase core domain-containing protein n=1 Tax=Shimia aestuarii TaxID=254406 RepID=UPI001FB35190
YGQTFPTVLVDDVERPECLSIVRPAMHEVIAPHVITVLGSKTAYIEPGSPWENGYCESFNARFRDEFLNGEIFYSLREAQIL